jgi:hypothetical protein
VPRSRPPFREVALGFCLVACGGEGRDALAPDSPPATPPAATSPGAPERYEILLREGPVVLGLAEARGADREKLADYTRALFTEVASCLAREHGEGRTKSGAARIVVVVDEAGREGGHKLAVDSVAANGHAATLCFEVPILARPLPFAPVAPKDRAGRGFAFDVRW